MPKVRGETIRPRKNKDVERKKDPGIAAALSFIWTGVGQAYNGEFGKALLLIFSYAALWILALFTAGICSPAVLIVWLYGMYDAYETAKKINRGELEE